MDKDKPIFFQPPVNQQITGSYIIGKPRKQYLTAIGNNNNVVILHDNKVIKEIQRLFRAHISRIKYKCIQKSLNMSYVNFHLVCIAIFGQTRSWASFCN